MVQQYDGKTANVTNATVTEGMQGGPVFIDHKFQGIFSVDSNDKVTAYFMTQQVVDWVNKLVNFTQKVAINQKKIVMQLIKKEK